MCNTKCKNEQCCHEEDLLCCEPIMHCCGGYSEHNNCCPHDKGCCNCCHKCGCCPCCCKLKGRIEDIENTIGGDEGINGELDDIKGSIEQMKENLDDLIEKEYNDVDDIKRDHKKDVDDINDRIDHVEDDCVELDRRVDVLEPAVNSLDVRLTTEIHDRAEQDVVYMNLAKEYADGKIRDLVDNAPEALDTLKEIADALKEDDDVMSALNQLIVEERTAREQGDHTLELADNSLSDALTREVHRATVAESGLSSDIAAETARAIAAETALGNRITNEIATERDRATAAETTLNDRITSEIVREATRADNALDTAINGLDSSIPSESNKAIAGVVISNGKISAHTKVAIPTKVSDITNDSNFQTGTQVNTSISNAIDGLDSTIPAVTNKAIASVTEENGILSGTYTDTISKAINDGGGRNIVNTYVDTITAANNQLHYHTGAGTTDITIPYSVKASQDANGDVISNTYLKIANAATDADATLQSASRTKIATVANTDLHVSLPRLVDNISLTLDPTTYKVSATLKGGSTTISTSNEIDLPLETMVVSGSYDSANKKVVLTLKNGQTVSFSVADLISGLVNTNDSRLSDARPASDVYNWAKQSTKPSYSWSEITGKPTIPDAQVQVNWAQNNSSAIDYIKNKPNLATVATSGSYNDLTNKPTLFSGNYNDLTNKPTLFSGNYNDLTNKPTIPSTNVTIGGTTYTLQQAIDYIVGRIPTQYWTRTNGTLKPATATDTVTAPAFYDSSVN